MKAKISELQPWIILFVMNIATSFQSHEVKFFNATNQVHCYSINSRGGGGGGTLGISGWGCAAGTLEPLTYTRASSAEFCYPILE